ncbi:SDR family oxidoreductase [Alkalimarinus alittae]|uniref:SDR family oxidoreductase n=1 Tax=Alkalimarinus alittae TaxID=2961619 RepID=A0ABY6N598_9ALTE|nr:SDR family oxidoreductase [Alkalimarinus alittae]UZE97157.1 SDR family oxidoreductase [Alkalimarinus alittae]
MNDKRIFITGGASGLGKAIAMRFAREGFKVCIGDVNDERGHEAETELKAIAPDALYLFCDVTKVKHLESVRTELEDRWGGVDIVVNNAGVAGTAGAIEDVSLADWQWVIDVNLMGVVRGCKTFTPLFKQQGSGHFVNIASAAGLLSAPMMSNYNATKAGVVSLSETLLAELCTHNITTSVVCPAFFQTNLTESMRSHIGGVHSKVNKLMSRSKITAEDVADSIFQAYMKEEFWVVTHPFERRMWYVKRLSAKGFNMLMQHQAKKLFRN